MSSRPPARAVSLALFLVATVALGQDARPLLPSLAPLVDSVKAAVVNVEVQKRASEGQQEMFERFFRNRRRSEEPPLNPGSGSGFIIDPKGLVLTNNHVVEGAVTIRVRLSDGKSLEGEVVGRDPLTDVALLRLKGRFDSLPFVRLGDSNQLRPGDWVVAIGNPFGLAQSVSAGIISALDRQIGASRYDQFLQTDAAINPGNSGGPLFNLAAEVVGMNTAIIGGGTGIGFAVPSNLIRNVLPQLQTEGHVTRGWLGVAINDLDAAVARALKVPQEQGAIVSGVNQGSPAEKAGLKEDDVIVGLDGEKIASATSLTRTVAFKRPDSTVSLSIYRDGKPQVVKVKLGTRPDLENIGELEPARPDDGQETHRRLGLSFQEIDPRMAESAGLPGKGALIVEVKPGSPAEEAGLARGMVVVEVNGRPVRSRDELTSALKGLKTGSVALLRLALPGGNGRRLVGLEIP